MDEKHKLAAEKLLSLARRELDEMNALFERDLYFGSVNRAYYAVFHAASALLILDGKRFKKHSAVKSCFGKDYVKAGIVSREYHELFESLFDIRNRVDYDYDTIVSREEAQWYSEQAKQMVAFLESAIRKRAMPIADK